MSTLPDAPSVLDQLTRILADSRFTRAPVLSRLLKFTVEETLAGRGDLLKEYVLGVEVCGRPPAYDTRTDPIVRVQTRELRRKLADYYETAGRLDPVVIELPKGRYLATFRAAGDQLPPAIASQEPVAIVVSTARPGFRQRAWVPAGVAAALVLAWIVFGGVRPLSPRGTAAPLPPSIAVLPFANLGNDPDDDYLSAGLTEEIISAAAHVDGLRVLGRTSVFRFNRASEDEREIARRLNVDAIVAGSIRRDGQRLRIAARLVRAVDGALLWSQTFTGDRAELFDVQERIARAIGAALAVGRGNDGRQARGSSLDPEARILYLKGRYFWNKRTRDDMRKAIEFFEQAVGRDPEYAQAFAGLAEAHLMGVWNDGVKPTEAIPPAKSAALAAVRLQPALAEAHTALGGVYILEWDWPRAIEALEHAMTLDPDYPRAAHVYAFCMLLMNRMDKSVAAIRLAQQLDPLSLIINADVVEILYYAGRNEEAIEQARKALELDPDFGTTHHALSRALRRQGLDQQALDEWIRGDELVEPSPTRIEALKAAAAARGWPGYEAKLVEQLTAQPAGSPMRLYQIGQLLARLGRTDEAFEWFERAYRQHDPTLINVGVDLTDVLHDDPRFVKLQQKLGLPVRGPQPPSTH